MRALSTFIAALLVSFVGAVHGAGNETTGHQHDSGQDMSVLPDWDQTFLSARIFLGRLPKTMPGSESDTPELIALGKRLYFEEGISTHKNQACHDCHFLTEGRAGADNTPTSKGALGEFGKRNAPTVINAGFQESQFWDGRAADLVEQAKGPILNPIEMGMRTEEEVTDRLKGTEGYEEAFRRAFPNDADAFTYHHLAVAIAAFERTLVAPSRFDQLLDGREDALTPQEKRGMALFLGYDCFECHGGPAVGGQLYRKIGVRRPYPDNADVGRFEVTKKEEDRNVFKVPMLRNVTRTQPYFHNGNVPTLKDAVHLMGHHQLGVQLSDETVADIIAFLTSLEGNPPSLTK